LAGRCASRHKAWLSQDDIEKGSMWFDEVTKQLTDVGVGILCVTRSNENAPWLLFEAGALCKGLPKNRVCPLLVDLEHTELHRGPLSHFNGTRPTREDLFNLVRTINAQRGEQALRDEQLAKAFNRCWNEFEQPFKEILTNHKPEEQAKERSTDDMVQEILSCPDPFSVRRRNYNNSRPLQRLAG
jgi:hypothetical protein